MPIWTTQVVVSSIGDVLNVNHVEYEMVMAQMTPSSIAFASTMVVDLMLSVTIALIDPCK